MFSYIHDVAGRELNLLVGERYRAESSERFGEQAVAILRGKGTPGAWESWPVARIEGLTPAEADAFVAEFNELGEEGRIWPMKTEAERLSRTLGVLIDPVAAAVAQSEITQVRSCPLPFPGEDLEPAAAAMVVFGSAGIEPEAALASGDVGSAAIATQESRLEEAIRTRKLRAVSGLASRCSHNHLQANEVLAHMEPPERYDFRSDEGLLNFALDAGAAIQKVLADRARARAREGTGAGAGNAGRARPWNVARMRLRPLTAGLPFPT